MDDFFPLFQRGREGESLRRGKSVGKKTEKTKGCRRSASYIDLDDRVLYTITFYLIEPVLLLSRVFLFLGLFEDSVIEDVATPSPEKNVARRCRDFLLRSQGHEDRVPRGWKWGEKRLLNLTAINGNIEFRGASRSYGARIRESSSSFSFISTEMDRKKERRVDYA